jgi:hypothetical protein
MGDAYRLLSEALSQVKESCLTEQDHLTAAIILRIYAQELEALSQGKRTAAETLGNFAKRRMIKHELQVMAYLDGAILE